MKHKRWVKDDNFIKVLCYRLMVFITLSKKKGIRTGDIFYTNYGKKIILEQMDKAVQAGSSFKAFAKFKIPELENHIIQLQILEGHYNRNFVFKFLARYCKRKADEIRDIIIKIEMGDLIYKNLEWIKSTSDQIDSIFEFYSHFKPFVFQDNRNKLTKEELIKFLREDLSKFTSIRITNTNAFVLLLELLYKAKLIRKEYAKIIFKNLELYSDSKDRKITSVETLTKPKSRIKDDEFILNNIEYITKFAHRLHSKIDIYKIFNIPLSDGQ